MEMQLFSLLSLIFIAFEMQVLSNPRIIKEERTIQPMLLMLAYTIWAIVGLFTSYSPYFITLFSIGALSFLAKRLYIIDEEAITRIDAALSLIVLGAMFFSMIFAN